MTESHPSRWDATRWRHAIAHAHLTGNTARLKYLQDNPPQFTRLVSESETGPLPF